MKQVDETAKHRVFVVWVDFMEQYSQASILNMMILNPTVFLRFLLKPEMVSQRFFLFALNKSYSNLATMI